MRSIHNLLNHHKKTVFFTEQSCVRCRLKEPLSSGEYPSQGYPLHGLTSFIGLTITESGYGVFADSFELTLNIDDVLDFTEKTPTRSWGISVELPQLNNKEVDFIIEDVAIDRTLGMYLIKCSSTKENIQVQNQVSNQTTFRRNGGI